MFIILEYVGAALAVVAGIAGVILAVSQIRAAFSQRGRP